MENQDLLNITEIAAKWCVSVRSARNYCASGRVAGAINKGGVWYVPADAEKPLRSNYKKKRDLLSVLRFEDAHSIAGGIYHKVQIELTYNSNHIEGSRLSHDQTRYIFETNTVGLEHKFAGVRADDVVETANHFRCIDFIIENANRKITENMIKKLHFILKNGTSDSRLDWFAVGEYKKMPNEVGGQMTTAPEDVARKMAQLLKKYRRRKVLELDDLLAFHHDFESIHPFQDGNGRVGRLILFKECLRLNIVPFIIDDEHKMFYYRGLREWKNTPGYLRDTCLAMQDQFKQYLDYFKIEY